MPSPSEPFCSRIEAYLQRAWGQETLRLEHAELASHGLSRETWFADVSWHDDTEHRRSLVVRMDPDVSLLPSGRKVEFEIYSALWAEQLFPVPEPLLLEDDPAALGSSFFVMQRIEGEGRPRVLAADRSAREIGVDLMSCLGRLVSVDHHRLRLDHVFDEPAPEEAWSVQLDRWVAMLDQFNHEPLPVTRAAIRRLRRCPPPPPDRVCVVHGDYRLGNALVENRRIAAIVDWEMAHLGDPHEDLAWFMSPGWRNPAEPGLVGGVLPPAETIRSWEAASGMPVDLESLAWYRLFMHVKANAIWVAAVSGVPSGNAHDLVYASFGWGGISQQEQWMLEDLELEDPVR